MATVLLRKVPGGGVARAGGRGEGTAAAGRSRTARALGHLTTGPVGFRRPVRWAHVVRTAFTPAEADENSRVKLQNVVGDSSADPMGLPEPLHPEALYLRNGVVQTSPCAGQDHHRRRDLSHTSPYRHQPHDRVRDRRLHRHGDIGSLVDADARALHPPERSTEAGGVGVGLPRHKYATTGFGQAG